MNSFLKIIAAAFLGAAACATVAAEAEPRDSPKETAPKTIYTCPMHPEVRSDKPGKCPICGMFLEPVKAAAKSEAPKRAEQDTHSNAETHAVPPTEKSAAAEKMLYTCGMHPQIIRDKPGDCPICGMKLVPLRKNAPSSDAAKPSQGGSVHVDADTIQKMNIIVADVLRGPAARTVRALGKVEYSQEKFFDVSLKYDAWIEKIFVNSQWADVKAGDPLFEVYSPDVYNAAMNYVVALNSDSAQLAAAAKARLSLLDAPANYVAEIEKTRKVPRTFVCKAVRGGVVYDKSALAGKMLKAGEAAYRMVDIGEIWVTAELYEKDAAFVKTGDTARVKAGLDGGDEFSGKVSLLEPEVGGSARTVGARIVVKNDALKLRPGAFAEAFFKVEKSPDAVLAPDTAVLRSGDKDLVFVALGNGVFEPRKVRLGLKTDSGFYEIIDGLSGGEKIVVSGQFLLDSESRLREAVQNMAAGGSGHSGN